MTLEGALAGVVTAFPRGPGKVAYPVILQAEGAMRDFAARLHGLAFLDVDQQVGTQPPYVVP